MKSFGRIVFSLLVATALIGVLQSQAFAGITFKCDGSSWYRVSTGDRIDLTCTIQNNVVLKKDQAQLCHWRGWDGYNGKGSKAGFVEDVPDVCLKGDEKRTIRLFVEITNADAFPKYMTTWWKVQAIDEKGTSREAKYVINIKKK